jgi:hypothetical protein
MDSGRCVFSTNYEYGRLREIMCKLDEVFESLESANYKLFFVRPLDSSLSPVGIQAREVRA